ncbi:DNA-directed RNA polymerase sigma-70 factor [Fulvitalea axinellae]|uniref:DNA-directed RNA polymerase sigma-70 factor n=1 Tax=Fulvitalea axinellae TaxID=1182444 RepID=A0AAU9CZB0_9BACT|nr:DNA-directed RNA polymerase sigma-70 factor [Fulvitalea axinellae]
MEETQSKPPMITLPSRSDCSYDHTVPIPEKKEAEIWQEFKAGSEVALVYIYKKFYHSLYHYASQFTKDREIISDSIHDLFIELMQKRERLADVSSIKFYLFRSVKISIIQKLKHYQRMQAKESAENYAGYDFKLNLSTEQLMIERAMTKENMARVNAALKKLSKKQREIIYCYYLEGLTIPEIAELMSFTNEKSAQNLLYKSLKSLRDMLLIMSTIAWTGNLFEN